MQANSYRPVYACFQLFVKHPLPSMPRPEGHDVNGPRQQTYLFKISVVWKAKTAILPPKFEPK